MKLRSLCITGIIGFRDLINNATDTVDNNLSENNLRRTCNF